MLGRSNAYIGFQDDIDEVALGHAQDEASVLSKLIFYWVNPLIMKGIAGYLNKIDDLFMLPESLRVTKLTENLRIGVQSTKSLFAALHKVHGIEFYSIGLFRLLSDMSGFAGPLLLGQLLTPNSSTTDPTETKSKSYIYVVGLLGSTLVGKHFCRITISSCYF